MNHQSPEFYLDQKFSFVSGEITFNVVVQRYNAEYDKFLLYDPEHPGSFYRPATFVYEHCQPAEAPVVRKVFPKIEIDKTRFLNLLSITDPLHPLNKHLKSEAETCKPQTALQRVQAIVDTLKRDKVYQKLVGCVYPSAWREYVYIEVRAVNEAVIRSVVDRIMAGHTDVEVEYKVIGEPNHVPTA